MQMDPSGSQSRRMEKRPCVVMFEPPAWNAVVTNDKPAVGIQIHRCCRIGYPEQLIDVVLYLQTAMCLRSGMGDRNHDETLPMVLRIGTISETRRLDRSERSSRITTGLGMYPVLNSRFFRAHLHTATSKKIAREGRYQSLSGLMLGCSPA